MRQGGRTKAMLDAIEDMRGLVRIPARDKHHARFICDLLRERGYLPNIRAAIQKGIMPQPHKSRRAIWVELVK